MQPKPTAARRVRRLVPPALLASALILVLVVSGPVGKSAARTTVLTVDPTELGREFAPGAVGLSLEADELATKDLSAKHKSLVALMRLLGPGVLRLGGGSVDFLWWTDHKEHPPGWATSVVTPSDLFALHGLLAATGWRTILGVDLGHFDPTRAANEARAAERILGSQLLGFEIGNEPDRFSSPVVDLRPTSYDVTSYLNEVAEYSVAMRGSAPSLQLYGPDLSSRSSWLSAIASAKDVPFAAITMHFYPTSYSIPEAACEGTPTPTPFDLVSPQARERENAVLQAFVSLGELAHREPQITETNATSSCDTSGGPQTSPVFASALWSFDWVLRATSAGVNRLDFHGYFGRCLPDVGSPICAPSYAAEARGRVIARPEYYGLLAARQLEGGHFIPIHSLGQTNPANLTEYATRHRHGVITVAIASFAAKDTKLLLRVPNYSIATEKPLAAPNLKARSGVTLGHASFSADGKLRSTQTAVHKRDHAFRLNVAPDSAVVITLRR